MTFDPTIGLHRIKNLITRQTEMREQCEQLLLCLADAIRHTEELAPVRTNPYPLRRQPRNTITGRKQDWRESHWEEAAWRYWNMDNGQGRPVPNAWEKIIGYQVMLRNENADQDWGEVDLLGVSEAASPVVIEMKGHQCTEPPLRPLVEAVAYAVALRKAWQAGKFADCWRKEFPNLSSKTPSLWPAVCVAPSDYWQWCRTRTALKDASRPLSELVAALNHSGFPPTFVEVEYDKKAGDCPASSLPVITGARIIDPTTWQRK